MKAFPVGWRSCRRRAAWTVLGLLAAILAGGPARAGNVEVFAELASDVGPDGVREVLLWIDEVEVTDRSSVSALRISYVPAEALAPGEHEARVEVVDALGRRQVRVWSFTVTAAEPAPEIVVFWSDELAIELDRMPRAVPGARLPAAGTTQPDAEVEVTRDGRAVARVTATASGRFTVDVILEPGSQELTFQAQRPWTGEEGRPVRWRVERLTLVPELESPVGLDVPVRVAPQAPRAELPRPAVAGEARAPVPVVAAPRSQVEPPADAADPLAEARRPLLGRRPDPGEVVITKPEPGANLVVRRLTVLGRAPAGWTVVVDLDGEAAGSDVANPAGRFTVEAIAVEAGEHVLVARATSPDDQRTLESAPVAFTSGPAGLLPAAVTLSAPARATSTTRGERVPVEGRAWPGAQVEVAVNGRLVATEIASATGRFTLLVPLEPGANHVAVEAVDPDTGRVVTAPLLMVRRAAGGQRPVRFGPGPGLPDEGLRPRLPRGGAPAPASP